MQVVRQSVALVIASTSP